MKKVSLLLITLLLLSVNAYGAKKLTEKNITKVLEKVRIAKEHKNIKAMRVHFLSRTSVSLSKQSVEDTKTLRLTFNRYKSLLVNKWKKTKDNLIEVKNRNFQIEENGKKALVKSELIQTIELNGIKTVTTLYETAGIKLVNGRVYINYYSLREMLNTKIRVN